MKMIVNIILLVAPFGIAYFAWNIYGQTVGIVIFIVTGCIAWIINKNVNRHF